MSDDPQKVNVIQNFRHAFYIYIYLPGVHVRFPPSDMLFVVKKGDVINHYTHLV